MNTHPASIEAMRYFQVLAVAVVLMLTTASCRAIDSGSVEFESGNSTRVARVGAQWDWDQKWFEGGSYYWGGYWDLDAALWRGTRYRNMPGSTQNIFDLGITPVFRLQRQGKTGPYLEASIGAHLLSDSYDNDGRILSSRFEFGDSVGTGYQFAQGWDIGLKFLHFSDGGMREPNSGVNFLAVRFSTRF